MATGANYIIPEEIGPKMLVADPFGTSEMRELIEAADRRLSALHDERQSYFEHWRTIGEFINPRRGKWIDRGSTKADEGGRKHGKIINNVAGKAGSIAAAGLHSGTTPRSRPWFRFHVGDPTISRNAEVKRWLHTVESILYEIFDKSNWYSAHRTNHREVADFGTGLISINENFANVIHCRQHTIGSYYLGNNHLGNVDSFYEEFTLTIEQMVQRYEWDNLSRKVKELFNSGNMDAWVMIVRSIQPNGTNYDPDGIGWQRGKFRQLEHDPADNEGKPLMLHPVYEFPFFVGLQEKLSDEAYGSNSFGMQALDDVKGLQAYEHRKARMLEQIATPALQGPTGLRGKGGAPRPGEMVYHDEVQGVGAIRPIHVPDPRIGELRQEQDAIEQRIYAAYNREVFQGITMVERGNMREIEVDARIREQMGQLGPVTEALTEALGDAIGRTFKIAERAGILPETPDALIGTPLDIDFISILAQAQKAQNVGAMMEFAQVVGGLTEMGFQKAKHRLNDDEFIVEIGEKLGVPPKVVNSDDEAADLAQQEAQAIKQAREAELQDQYAQTAKTASETELSEGGTVLDAAQQAAGRGGPQA